MKTLDSESIAGFPLVTRLISRKVELVREEGVRALPRILQQILLAALLLPAVIAMRLLKPFVVVRLGGLSSKRIGHLAGDTELYLCERDAGLHGKRTLDLFYHTGQASNLQLKKMWDRTLHVSSIARLLVTPNRLLPGGDGHVIDVNANGSRDVRGLLARTPTHLSFTSEEDLLGGKAVQELGIPEGAPFVCFHARDSAYLDSEYPNEGRGETHAHRDSAIDDYMPGVEELTRRGYFAVRMGSVVKEPLGSTNEKIIDYATNGSRTDFLDIFLGAHCSFFLGSGSGIDAIPALFRRPVAYVNYIPLGHVHTWHPNHLFIPKKLWLRRESRYLTFREIADSEIGVYLQNQRYEQAGIETVGNTPEEISALAVEMAERVDGTRQTTDEDEELQRRFQAILKPNEIRGTMVSRIGAEFLSRNRDLLD